MLSPEEALTTTPKTWYLPHHPVFHPAKPNKVRIVFDTAAKCQGTSLNDNLVQGPHLTNEVVDVLLRFRTGEVPIVTVERDLYVDDLLKSFPGSNLQAMKFDGPSLERRIPSDKMV